MKYLVYLMIALLPVSTLAANFPAFYDVTGVAADDTLNVRAGPMGTDQKLAELGPNQSNIEIVAVSESGKWGLLNIGERSGWASMRYLKRQPGQDANAMPRQLSCFGTEPYWALDIGEDPEIKFTLAGNPEESLRVQNLTRSRNNTGKYGMTAQGALGFMTASMTAALCNDGMSDRNFGISVDIIVGSSQFSGCCTLVP
ncbi:MAG: peptide-binding protein [Rhodobacterales bacterium]|nr:peptide-binding protein [Rhodobacterales bacterium]